jgi:hypothetical protein
LSEIAFLAGKEDIRGGGAPKQRSHKKHCNATKNILISENGTNKWSSPIRLPKMAVFKAIQ